MIKRKPENVSEIKNRKKKEQHISEKDQQAIKSNKIQSFQDSAIPQLMNITCPIDTLKQSPGLLQARAAPFSSYFSSIED